MRFQFVPYLWLLLASALVTLVLGIYALRQKDVRGALPFGCCMLLTALWSAGNALEIAGLDLPTKLFWTNVQCMSYSFTALLWLIMVFRFVERDRWVTRRNLLLLLALPVLTVILAWTNGRHGLMWQNVHLDTDGPFPIVAKTFGPWFWIIAAYSYGLNMVSQLLLALSWRRKSALYREQARALFAGLALLIIQNALYIFGIHPVARYDLTPVVAGLSGLVIAWGIFSFRLFDIIPVARDNIIENMADGLIVLDAQNRIVDMNPAAQQIFGGPHVQAIGHDAGAFFKSLDAFTEICAGREMPEIHPRVLAIGQGGRPKLFEVSYLSLPDRRGNHTGRSIIIHEVTEQRMAQAKLLEQQRSLAMSEERERLARDLHDNLGQVFGFINVQAQAIKHELAQAGVDTASPKLDRLVEAAQAAHREMRAYIKSVKHAAAVEKELVPAIQNEVEQFAGQTGVKTRLELAAGLPAERLTPAAGVHIVNIVKEALHNIRKHAAAQTVSIEIKTAGNEICASIADDGRGFDPGRLDREPARRLGGYGLNIMRERAAEIGGTLRIDSAPGQGTKITLHVPLQEGASIIDHEGAAG